MEAPRLFPTQKVGGLVELSTFTRRTLVMRGRRYSVISPVLAFTRTMRSFDIPPVHAYPVLSKTASQGLVQAVGMAYSVNFSVLVSNIPILLPRNSANHNRSWSSMCPRRGPEFGVGVRHGVAAIVFAFCRVMHSSLVFLQ